MVQTVKAVATLDKVATVMFWLVACGFALPAAGVALILGLDTTQTWGARSLVVVMALILLALTWLGIAECVRALRSKSEAS